MSIQGSLPLADGMSLRIAGLGRHQNASLILGACPTLTFYCGERSATICVVLGPLPRTVKREA